MQSPAVRTSILSSTSAGPHRNSCTSETIIASSRRGRGTYFGFLLPWQCQIKHVVQSLEDGSRSSLVLDARRCFLRHTLRYIVVARRHGTDRLEANILAWICVVSASIHDYYVRLDTSINGNKSSWSSLRDFRCNSTFQTLSMYTWQFVPFEIAE